MGNQLTVVGSEFIVVASLVKYIIILSKLILVWHSGHLLDYKLFTSLLSFYNWESEIRHSSRCSLVCYQMFHLTEAIFFALFCLILFPEILLSHFVEVSCVHAAARKQTGEDKKLS